MITPNNDQSPQDLAQQRTGWAYERTQMAAIRTYFALLRTGLAIAGGGAIITGILARGWPEWVIALVPVTRQSHKRAFRLSSLASSGVRSLLYWSISV